MNKKFKYEFPEEIITREELAKIASKREDELHFEVGKIEFDKKSLKLIISVKLNFVMSQFIKKKYKEWLRTRIDGIKNIEFIEIYDNEYSSNNNDKSRDKSEIKQDRIIYGKRIKDDSIEYREAIDLIGDKNGVVVEGEIFKINEPKKINKETHLVEFVISKSNDTLRIKFFMKSKNFDEKFKQLVTGEYVKVFGDSEIDKYDKRHLIKARSINIIDKPEIIDRYENGKRVELHAHTVMSDNDGFTEAEYLVNQAAKWNQKAVAITDHGVVQSFPDACMAADKLAKKGIDIKIIYGMEGYIYDDEGCINDDGSIDIKKKGTNHIILLAKNMIGLKNLYKLVSISHIDYFYKKPRLPRTIIEKYREGIIIGSACEAGEVYRALLDGKTEDELLKIASFYDYLEIQPRGNNRFLVEKGILSSEEDILNLNKKVVELGDKLGKLTVATTDAHYPTAESAIYRNIIMYGMGFSETNSNNLYLKTTDEMIEEFDYLGERAHEVVVTNTNKIADMIEVIRPIPAEKYYPEIPDAKEKLYKSCYDRAGELYGDPLPPEIKERLEKELESIIGNGYAALYIAAQMLIKKSEEDGYVVGSRGSVGSSFAATMAGITEINPIAPHYRCPKCKHFEFAEDILKYDVGFDMPDKKCPKCGELLIKDGFNIPFATFLGFKGDKEPDIDLNFAGEYQARAHKYVGKIFGEKNIFKAGTVSKIKDRTAFGFVKKYIDETGLNASQSDIDLLVKGCSGVKRTTGQHPGGIIVLPEGHEIYEFTPIQKPANKRDSDIITTHYDYHKIDNNLLKLDILGHDAPSILRHLQDMTGVEPKAVPLDDEATMSIFTSLDALKIKIKDYKFKHGTYAIPEFGTHFTRGMLDAIKPTTYSELVKMSGFSHGTKVWQGNAEDLIKNNIAGIDEVISCRDDIMNYLIVKGVEDSKAFSIMEHVRKNKDLTTEEIDIMRNHDVPEWYIESCKTLQYLFPRAHAAAYVMHALRFAWFKVNYPVEFYAAYLTTKADDFDVETVSGGISSVLRKIGELENLSNSASQTEKNQLTVLEVVYEIFARGFEFSMPILGKSDPLKFNAIDGKINIPYRAFNGIGDTAAISIDDEYKKERFFSLDDVRARTKLAEKNIEMLASKGVFGDIPNSAQISIMELMS